MTPIPIRPVRFDMNVSLSFKIDDGVVEGHCVNVSASGMLAVFSREVDLFTKGEISLRVGEYFVNITARVARVLNGDHGLAFQIDNENDRKTTQVLVDYAATMHQP